MAIGAATGSQYVVQDADATAGLVCGVTAENAAGRSGVGSNVLIVGGRGPGSGPGAITAGGVIRPPSSLPNPQTTARPACRTVARTRLRRQLGKAARIGALLKAGGYRARFAAPCAGRLEIRWYRPPARAKRPPVLVARGAKTLAGAGAAKLKLKLTPKGRRLLRGASRLKLVGAGAFKPAGGLTVATSKRFVLRR